MKKLSLILVLGLLAFGAQAAEPAKEAKKEPTAQQQRMKQCNADAEGKKGDERKAFMKSCLSNKAPEAAAASSTQQSKMKQCNADAKGKSGDERKAFMKSCLSNKA
ncbi:PsiF family protein [Roseateles sp. BYS180W]|uniref:PsiF family protein n=1 Tax=Roseateles rivi TaxID=3299028 RepID=A0ABW7FTR7_9BURK